MDGPRQHDTSHSHATNPTNGTHSSNPGQQTTGYQFLLVLALRTMLHLDTNCQFIIHNYGIPNSETARLLLLLQAVGGIRF